MAEQVYTEIIVDARGAKEGITSYTEALTYAGEATDQFGNKITGGFSRAEKAADMYLAKLDPTFAATQRLGKETQTIGTAIDGLERQLMRGSLTTDVYNQRMALLAGRMGEVKATTAELASGSITAEVAMKRLSGEANAAAAATNSLGLTARQSSFFIRAFALDAVAGFSALAAGAPLASVATMELSRLGAQLFTSKVGFAVLKQTIAEFFTAGGGLIAVGTAIAGMAAALAGLAFYAEGAARKEAELRDQISASRTNYVNAAKDVQEAAGRVSAATSASRTDAVKAAQAFASMASFRGTVDDLTKLTMTAQGLAHVLGTTLPEAAAKMAAGMREPTKVAFDLASGAAPLRTLDAALLLTISHLEQIGKKSEAAALLQKAFAESAKAATQNLTPMQAALHELATLFHEILDPTQQFGKSLGEVVTNAAAQAIREVTAAIKELKGVLDSTDTGGPQTLGGALKSLFSDNLVENARALKYLADRLVGAAGGGKPLAEGPAVAPVSPAYPAALEQNIGVASRAFNLDPAFLSALQRSENVPVGGFWPTSSAGAIGAMQMKQATFAGMQGQPNQFPTTAALGPRASLTDQGTNIVAGGEFAAYLLSKYKSVELAVLAWHDGEPRIDAFLKGAAQPSQDARKQADLILSQYKGTGFASGEFGMPPMPSGQELGFARSAIAGAGLSNDMQTQQKDIDALIKKLQQLEDAKKALRMEPFLSDDQKNLMADMDRQTEKLTEDLKNAQNPLRQDIQALQDQAKATEIVGGADRRLLQVRQEIARQRQANPTTAISDAQAAEKIAQVTSGLTAEYNKQNAQMRLTIDQQDALAASWEGGAESAARASAEQKAYNDVIETTASASPEFNARLAERTALYDEQAAGLHKIQAAQESFGNRQQISMLQEEISSLGMASDERQLYLQHLRDEFELKQKYPQEADAPYRAALLKERDTMSELSQVYRNRQRDLNMLSGMFQSAFDTIGNAITEAFVQGEAAAVNWGNIVKAVVSQVIKALLQLAIINPLMNAMFGGIGGQTAPTLFSMMGAGGPTSGGSFGGGGGMMQQGLGVLGVGNQLSGGALTNSLGLTGQGGLFTNIGQGVSGFLATPIGAGAFVPEAGLSAAAGGAYPLPSAGMTFGAPATIGGALGGVGAGFTVGSLAGSQVQQAMNKTGPGPEIGAGIGAAAGVAGAVLAPATFGTSLLIAGLIGGLLGGTAGGMIGPRPQSPFSSIGLSIGPNGQLVQGATIAQKADTAQLTQNTTDQVRWLNAVMGAHGLGLTGLGSVGSIGTNTPGGFQAPWKAQDFATAFPQMRFGMQGPGGTVLEGRSFGNVQELSDVTVAVEQFVATLQTSNAADRISDFLATLGSVASADIPKKLAGITAFVTETVPTLLGERNIGSLSTAINQINSTFGPAIQMAQELSYKEAELTAARDAAIKSATEQVVLQEQINNQALTVRLAQAQATVTGDTSGILPAQLDAFDLAAQQQRLQMTQHLKDVYGDTVTQTEGFTGVMALLEKTLATERLAVMKQYSQEALGIVTMTEAQVLQAQHQLRAANTNLDVRFWQAQGGIDPTQARAAAEYAMAVQQEAERRDFSAGLIATWGESFTATKDFADEMALLERTLAVERLAVQEQYNRQAAEEAKRAAEALAQASRSFTNQALGLSVRELNARASMDPRLGQAAQLYAFDIAANQERTEFVRSTVEAFGEAYTATASYAVEAARLEQTLATERLAIQERFNDQSRSAATATLTSLADYAASLTRSDLSPLSPMKQYDLAQSQFNAVSGAAVAGDFASIQKFQQFSDAFLQASRGVHGSGAGFATDFDRVMGALGQISAIPEDRLTASAYAAEMQSQTTQLLKASTDLGDLLKSIRDVIEQAGNAPVRAKAA